MPNLQNKLCFFCLLLFFLIPSSSQATPCSGPSCVQTSRQKKFDFDKNGWLSFVEKNAYLAHRRFGWPLVKKKQVKYDLNQDHLLQPHEKELYKKSRKKKKK